MHSGRSSFIKCSSTAFGAEGISKDDQIQKDTLKLLIYVKLKCSVYFVPRISLRLIPLAQDQFSQLHDRGGCDRSQTNHKHFRQAGITRFMQVHT